MRTTVNIDDDLLAKIKVIAATKHAALGDIVDDALREYLAERAKPVADFSWADVAIEVPGDQGMRPGINWRSNSAMLDAMEDL
ncbi:type II toxin-antitoxin system VapB family antitoxin [Microbacterium sp. Mu-80]|uniref:Type II toxin-antitoxin system VapB family antitoxin n=1 Tax=Microbacterium bandirmense TaxID=3122050 RepID=A0ABU8LA68_9MICO